MTKIAECHGQFNWINSKTLSTEQQYHKRKIREPLEIRKAKITKRRKLLNRNGNQLDSRQTQGLHFLSMQLKLKPTQRCDVKFKNYFNRILYAILKLYSLQYKFEVYRLNLCQTMTFICKVQKIRNEIKSY